MHRLHHDRRGLEIAINTIVILIIGILLFTLSIYLVFFIKKTGTDIVHEIDLRTQEEIRRLLVSQNAVIAIPFNSKTVQKGEFADFGLGVRNIGTTQAFAYEISFDLATTMDGKKIIADRFSAGSYINRKWLGGTHEGKYVELDEIRGQDMKVFTLNVRPDASMNEGVATKPGEYLFNVCVYDAEHAANKAGRCNPDAGFADSYYTGKIYSVTVVVR